ncbi:MAG: apolipoprotein N-acyltransferase [Sphingobium sp.]
MTARADRHPLLLALAAGAAGALGFAPLGWWPLSLLALAVLIRLAGQARTARRAFLIGWNFGLGHFTLGLNWIAHAFTYQDAMPHWFGYGAVLALSLFLALYPGLATGALHVLRKRNRALPVAPLFAGIWVLTEYGRATIFTGFAWNPLGMIWLGTGVDQSARWIGTYGLSALAILAGGAVLACGRRRWTSGAPVLAALAGLALIGHLLLPGETSNTSANTPAITIVQPNIDQSAKYDPALDQENFTRLARLTGPSSPDRPRLVFWPEAALPAWLDMEPEWRWALARLIGPHDLLMTGGVKVYFDDSQPPPPTGRKLIGAHNSAWVLTPDARLIARYDKAHLVPYGEYLPMRAILQPLGLSRLVPGDTDFWPGPGPRSLALPARPAQSAQPGRNALKMGVQICYEIIFSGQVVDRKDRPAFLYNPSNDAWFGDWGPPQHLAQARMRAIEEAMPILRSTPTGISAVIDGHGRLLAHVPHHQAGAINSRLPQALAPTPFARFGNLLPLGLALALIALAVATARRRR